MLATLDTIIAIVIVLLVLSLIVQSIQSLIKKLLKLKSNVVFDSMQDLFKYIEVEKLVGKTPQELVDQVTKEFEKLGRVSLIRKNPMLDSIAKGDLQKILEKKSINEETDCPPPAGSLRVRFDFDIFQGDDLAVNVQRT